MFKMFITFHWLSAAAHAAFGLYLLFGAVCDIRRRSVSVRYLLFGSGLTVLLSVILYRGTEPVPGLAERLFGAVPGLLCILTARLRPRSIGPADGALAVMIGVLDGCCMAAACLITAFALTALFGLAAARAAGKSVRGYALPFIPFMTAGYVAGGLLWTGNLV